jgi:amidase
VALATGQVWLAEGSDLGGSLRTPAAFNSVVGLRPTPGRVARAPTNLPYDILGVNGPMARNVSDLALMLDAMVGDDPGDPIALPAPDTPFTAALKRGKAPKRVAFSPDLGICTVDPEIASVCAEAAAGFSALGAEVVQAAPDFTGAYEAFQTLRAMRFAAAREPLLATHRDKLKPDVIWNIEEGLKLTGPGSRAPSACAPRCSSAWRRFSPNTTCSSAPRCRPSPIRSRRLMSTRSRARR